MNLLQVAQNPRQNLSMGSGRKHPGIESSLAAGDLPQPGAAILETHEHSRKRVDVDRRIRGVDYHPDQKMAREADSMSANSEPLGDGHPQDRHRDGDSGTTLEHTIEIAIVCLVIVTAVPLKLLLGKKEVIEKLDLLGDGPHRRRSRSQFICQCIEFAPAVRHIEARIRLGRDPEATFGQIDRVITASRRFQKTLSCKILGHRRDHRTTESNPHLAAARIGATLGSMVTIGMNYDVLEGKEEVFEGACKKVLEVMDEANGHDDSQIFRRVDRDESAQYLIVSRWQDEAAFKDFIASESFKKVTSWGLKNVLAGRPSHTTYQES